MSLKKRRHLSSSQIIIFGFFGVIMAGAILLSMPFSSQSGEFTNFLDALFTSTSATCVTGLIVRDTATYWNSFGQCIILILIQIGGLGVVTVAVAIATYSGRKIGLMQRSTMQEAISAPSVGGIVKFTRFILKGVFLIEGIGAVLMYPSFAKEFGYLKGIWYACFHSISAFCNAGFDLMGVRQPYSSLTYFSGNFMINVVIMILIVIGGIGFLVWGDVLAYKTKIRQYRMQSKVVLVASLILILVPVLYFYVFEFSRGRWDEISIGNKVLYSFFQSITTRTAGFNTVDFNALTESGILIMIILMLIGGSPGSTAGGMKTTTIAVMVASAWSVFFQKEDTNFFGRRVSKEVIRDAATILIMYLVLFTVGTVSISIIETMPVLTSMFEVSSAIATVGLTLGMTPHLHAASKLILIVLMFLGRVGGLTIIFAASASKKKPHRISRMPKEKITVG